ncbi:MAG TPA: ferritin-like domain-containing protein [Ktedonobacterales bacterium]|nr:ferritin-like domain-containing protein [Ktedonobacterales bacterium]
MSTEVETTNVSVAQATAEGGMRRYYTLAKKQAWEIKTLPWNDAPPVPEGSNASPEKKARRHSMWRSVVTQQLQADIIAVQCATQLFTAAPDWDARLYYTTMINDESRHSETWMRLSDLIGGTCEWDPHLEKLGNLTMNLDNVEEKVWLFQCAFEGMVIPRFRQIAAAAPNTVLGEVCTRIAIDDGIHHGSGVAYEKMLLERITPRQKREIERISREMWPLYIQHITWRPRERAWASAALRSRDYAMVKQQREDIIRMAAGFGMDIEFDLPM